MFSKYCDPDGKGWVSSHVLFDQFTQKKLTLGADVVGDDVGLFVGV